MRQFLITVLLSFLFIINCTSASSSDATLTTPELIVKYGYPVEVHEVTTDDGYILTMHRIPYSPKSPAALNKPVVFLQHGLFSSSADSIILGPQKSLGYLLADAGYDVWMGNARGNTYSKDHETLSTSAVSFWDFSWHEMGIYDLPAEIDYVLAVTEQNNLYYVGHSMGTTMFYVLTSMRPEYNSKIRHMVALAPIAYMGHVSNALAKIGAYLPGGKTALSIAELLGVGELFPSGKLWTLLTSVACSDGSLTQAVCSNIVFMLCGYDSPQMNETVLPALVAHSPAGASTKTVLHYAQEISSYSHEFRQWDYSALNLLKYGSLSPPKYNLNAITAPITLMYGDNDPFGDYTDVLKLYQALPSAKALVEVKFSSFNHIDFLWANDIKPLVNDVTINIIKSN